MDGRINRTKFMLVDKGKTNLWLAMQLGKDPATVSKWCANSAQPSLETIMQIAKLLNVDMNDLVRFEALPDMPSREKTEENIQKEEKLTEYGNRRNTGSQRMSDVRLQEHSSMSKSLARALTVSAMSWRQKAAPSHHSTLMHSF